MREPSSAVSDVSNVGDVGGGGIRRVREAGSVGEMDLLRGLTGVSRTCGSVEGLDGRGLRPTPLIARQALTTRQAVGILGPCRRPLVELSFGTSVITDIGQARASVTLDP